jgi:hypothetical protein
MNLIALLKTVFKNKIKTQKPNQAFALYCKNNPSANACKIYDL